MAVLWTDVIDPAELSGYARESLADYEARRGTLARWLPNREIQDVVARFVKGATGLVDVALFRAFDAEPEMGNRKQGKRITLDLPALGQNIPVSEYEQLRLRGAMPDEASALATIQNTTDIVVRAVADAIERMRGVVLSTGKATIDQYNFQTDDDFGRSASHQVTAASLWTTPTVSRLAYLQLIVDQYTDSNGEPPGAMVMSTRVARALAGGDEFVTQLNNAATRPGTTQQVNDTLIASGFPMMTVYDRRVSVNGAATKVLPDDIVLLLPVAVETDDWQGTDLGATFWGRTLTSTEPDWGIGESEQPGIVAGVYRHPKPPMGIEVISDAIALPVLANADRSLRAKVL